MKFFKKSIVNQEGYVPPDEYNTDFESASLKPEDYSDIGQAKVLVREYGNELKYTSATDFLRFDKDQTAFRVQDTSKERRMCRIPCEQVFEEIFDGKIDELITGNLKYI